LAKKDQKTVVEQAAKVATNGCTLKIFMHAHARHSLTLKKETRANPPLKPPSIPSTPPPVVRSAHQAFEVEGRVPFWVRNFLLAGHHLKIAA
jgi:hypothetical protein